MEEYDYITCRICGERKRSLLSHIICIHDMDPDEYKDMFNVGYIVCKSVRVKISESQIPGSGYVPLDKAQVVNEMKKYASEHKPLRLAWLDHKKPSLVRQVYHIFGDFETFEKETGISVKKVNVGTPLSDREEVIEKIRQLHKQGFPINYLAVLDIDSSLVRAAAKLFGCWGKAVTEAGFDILEVDQHRKWDKRRVVKAIKKYYREGIPLNYASIIKNDGVCLYEAAQRYFGSWEKAVVAAGLDVSKARKLEKWDREKTIKGIKECHRNGIPLNHASVRKADAKLYEAGNRYFGSWGKALAAAGYDSSESSTVQKWNKEKIISAIREYDKKGVPLNFSSMNRLNDKLYQAAQRYFGNWKNAVEAAGFNSIPYV